MAYFAPTVNGANVAFKVQFENANGGGGTNPPGDWTYVSGPTTGNQGAFQGSGYYIYGSTTSTDYDRAPVSESYLTYTVVVPQGQAGQYSLRARAAKDPGTPNDAQNDIWVRIDGNAESLLVNDTDAVSNNGFVKLYDNPLSTTSWDYAFQIDSVAEDEANFRAVFDLSAGTHNITFAGRAEGFHVDFWELYKGNTPALAAPNSVYVPDGETSTWPVVNDPIDNVTLAGGAGGTILVPTNTFNDADGDALTLTAAIPAALQGFASFSAGARSFTVGSNTPAGTYALSVTARDNDGNAVTDTFNLTVGGTTAAPDLAFRLLGAGGFVDQVLADGDSYTAAQLGATPTFSGEFVSGAAASVRIQVLNAQGTVIGGKIENVTPYDYTYSGPAFGAGDYTLRAVAYSGTNATGSTLATEEIDFEIETSGGGGGGSTPVPGTVSAAIGASADDFETIGGAGSTDLEFGTQKGRANAVGLRFDGLDLTETADIESAYFVFKAEANGTGAANFQVQIQNSLAAVSYSAGSSVNARSYLSETVAWSNVATWQRDQTYQSADVSRLIEALLGANDLDAQNALGFRISGTGLREAYAFNASAADAPRLVVNYVDDFVL